MNVHRDHEWFKNISRRSLNKYGCTSQYSRLRLAPQVTTNLIHQPATMCVNTMTHFTCIWCKELYDSRMEQVLCHRALGTFGSCGKMSGANKSVYHLFCPSCSSEKYKKASYRDPKWSWEYEKRRFWWCGHPHSAKLTFVILSHRPYVISQRALSSSGWDVWEFCVLRFGNKGELGKPPRAIFDYELLHLYTWLRTKWDKSKMLIELMLFTVIHSKTLRRYIIQNLLSASTKTASKSCYEVGNQRVLKLQLPGWKVIKTAGQKYDLR